MKVSFKHTYDSMGKILTLKRNGLQDGGTYGLMDRLTLSYDGNQLTGVSETAADYDFNGSFEYKKAKGSQYIYNSNGSLVADKSRGIAYISYDFNNNPQTIYFTNGYMTKYTYSALGDKLCVEHFMAQPNVTWALGVKPDVSQIKSIYAGHTDYLLGGRLIEKEGVIKRLFFDGGYVDAVALSPTTTAPTIYDFKPYYYNTDHLGNNREVMNAKSDVQQLTNYYPFGAPYADPVAVVGSTVQQYKYNGKELDVMHGLNTYDYGARQYYPILGRWDRMDPLCEKYYNVSPYAYCLNNPMKYVDFKGLAPGDFFLTVDEAAIDFGMYYNDNSIRDKKEYGSSIIMVVNSKGQKGYTYTVANRGNCEKTTCSKAPLGYTPIAEIHTHGHYTGNDPISYYDNDFSGMPRDKDDNIDNKVNLQDIRDDMDIGNANKRQRDSYLATPNGSLKKYSPQTGKVTLLSTDMPSDYNDPERVNNRSSFIEANPIKNNTEILQLIKILSYGSY